MEWIPTRPLDAAREPQSRSPPLRDARSTLTLAGGAGDFWLGVLFTLILWTLLNTAGNITKAVDEIFNERSIHTLELLKGFEQSYSMKLMEMSGSATTNDLLGKIVPFFITTCLEANMGCCEL